MKKESFIIYKSFYEPIRKLSDQELGELFRALFEYQIKEKEPSGNSKILMPFEFFKNQFNLDSIKYEKVVERNQKNGLKGGRPKTQNKPINPMGYSEPKKAYNGNGNVIVNGKEKEKDNVKDLEGRKLAFAETIKIYLDEYPKPLLLEFFEYWTEHGDKDKKMRFEKQTSFSIQRRIKTWARNENKFNNHPGPAKKGKVDDDYIKELKDRLS
jgi:hypothetical protein